MGSQPSLDFWIHTPQKSTATATARTSLEEQASTATLASSIDPVSRGDCEVAGLSDSAGSLMTDAPGVVDAVDSGHSPSPSIGTENPAIPQVAGKKSPSEKKKRGKRPRILLHEVFESTPKPKTPKPTKEKRAVPQDKPTKRRKYMKKNNSNGPSIEEVTNVEHPSVKIDVTMKASTTKRVLNFDLEGSNLKSPQTCPSDDTFKQVVESRSLDDTFKQVVDSRSLNGPLMRTCRSVMQLRCNCCLCRLDKITLAFPKEYKRTRTSIRVAKARRRRIMPTGGRIQNGFKCTLALTHSLLQCTKKRKMRMKRLNQEHFQQAIRWIFDSPKKDKGLRGKNKKPTKKRATKKTKAKDMLDNVAIEDMVDFISKKFEKLCINFNAIIPYEKKKAKIKAEVVLDPETMRVSNILKDREDGSDPVKETDEEKQKWWEEQRKDLWAKVYPAIVCLRIFLGDRQFSPWKGSVVDSVVGVFLTQNVSDHLSSNAYMSLMARYPAKIASEDTRVCKECETASHHEQGEVIGATMGDNKECCNELGVTSSQEDNSTEQDILDKAGENDLGIAIGQGSTEGNSIEREGLDKAGEKDCFIETSSAPQQKMDCPDNTNTAHVSHQTPERKTKKKGKDVEDVIDWDTLRRTYSNQNDGKHTSQDSVDWDAVRRADVKEIAKTIVERGQHNILAAKIKDFLDRIVKDHGSTDLEWLRDVPPLKAKEYLLDIYGLGLKSVECLRLLTLHHHAFPVDTNVGRIVIRLGWVPLQPLEDSLQLHDIDDYPIMDKIQTYLWPRLCNLTQEQLYEFHYLLITHGKVFCTKIKPNCNACPLRNGCKYYASASARARLALLGKEQKSGKKASTKATRNPFDVKPSSLTIPPTNNRFTSPSLKAPNCEPIIEEPPSPEPERVAPIERDIEDLCSEDTDEIPFFNLCASRLIDYMNEHEEKEMEKALATLSPEAASIPAPKQKEISRLRTEHRVYELPDDHPLLKGLEKREKDDPCPYLLAIWTQDENKLNCHHQEKSGCDCQEQDHLTVPGTLLIPCRSAMRGRFPLNGTYFQVNEVFADDETSRRPINVPRKWIWELNKRTLYCGSSTTAIARDIPIERILDMFWRGFVCVRGFNRKTRAPKPIPSRFHWRAIAKKKMEKNEE